MFKGRSPAESTKTTANDRLLHFMTQLPLIEKDTDFGGEPLIDENATF